MILDTLTNAIESGETLRVRYLGGSHPGAIRDVQPLAIKGDKVRAAAVPGGEIKTFFIDKMELAEADAQVTELQPAPPIYDSPDALLEHEQATLESLGWLVVHDGNTIKLDRTCTDRKGRPVTVTEVSLQLDYGEYFDGEKMVKLGPGDRGRTVEYSISLERGAAGKLTPHTTVNVIPGAAAHERPWKLSATGHNARAYHDFAKAEPHFMEFARELAPSARTDHTSLSNAHA